MSPTRKTTAAPSGPSWFRYIGQEPRTYLFDGSPAVIAASGVVSELPTDPGDGAWEPCSAPETTPSSTDTAE